MGGGNARKKSIKKGSNSILSTLLSLESEIRSVKCQNMFDNMSYL